MRKHLRMNGFVSVIFILYNHRKEKEKTGHVIQYCGCVSMFGTWFVHYFGFCVSREIEMMGEVRRREGVWDNWGAMKISGK